MALATQESDKISKKRRKVYVCSVCGMERPFCWSCKCGFQICNKCMDENLWGLTCSGVLWECPECGEHRPF